MPIEPDARSLLSIAEEELAKGNYESTRQTLTRALKAAADNATLRKRVEELQRHLGESNEADSFKLLRGISRERKRDPRKTVELVKKALDSGLRFTLPERLDLRDLLAAKQTEIVAEQQRYVSELILKGDVALDDRKFEEAREHYRQASAVLDMSPEIQAQIKAGLQKCEHEINEEQRLGELISNVTSLIAASQYSAALALLKDKTGPRLDDPRRKDYLDRAQNGVKARGEIEALIRRAQEIEGSDPVKAERDCEEAQRQSELFDLADLRLLAQEGIARATGLQRTWAIEAEDYARQAEVAWAGNELGRAIDLYKQASEKDPKSQAIALRSNQLRAQIEQQKRSDEDVKKLKLQGKEHVANKKWEAALESYQRVKALSPGDPDIEKLIVDTQNTIRFAVTTLQTMYLVRLPYPRPQDMLADIRKLQDLVNVPTLAAIRKEFNRVFRREVTAKLREYLESPEQIEWEWKDELQPDPIAHLADSGRFAEALQRCQDSYAEWLEYIDSERRDIPALRARLKILEAYKNDLVTAQEVWNNLQPARERIAEALKTQRYDEAVTTCREVLFSLEVSEARSHYVLGRRCDGVYVGIWQSVRHDFVTAARNLAVQWKPLIADDVWRAENFLHDGNTKGASEIIRLSFARANDLKRAKEEHDRIDPAGWPLSESPWETVYELKRQIDSTIEINLWLREARVYLNQGHFTEAAARYREVLVKRPDMRLAQDGLKDVDRLEALILRRQESNRDGNLLAERSILDEIVRLAPNFEWAKDSLHEIRTMIDRVRQLEAWRADARLAKGKGDAEGAGILAQKVLDVQHDSEMQTIANWARSFQTGRQEREAWKEEARSNLRKGKFEDALVSAEKVLAQDTSDLEAPRLRDRAQQAINLLKDARTALKAVPPAYQVAVDKLSEIPILTESQSGEWVELLGDAQRALGAARGYETLLSDIKLAADDERWLDVLKKAKSVPRQEARGRRYIYQAEQAVRDSIAVAIDNADWERVKLGIQALRLAGSEDEQIAQWQRQYDRAELLRQAQLSIEQGTADELNNIVVRLDRHLEQNADEEASDLRRRARIELFRQQAEQAASLADFDRARESFISALNLKPELDIRNGLQASLDKVLTELALSRSASKLAAGDLTGASEALGLAPRTTDDTRLEVRRSMINRIGRLFDEATTLEKAGDYIAAVQRLDEALGLQRDFPPAVERRSLIVSTLLNAGKQAEAKNDLWTAREAYEILRSIAPQADTNLEDIQTQLESQLRDLAYRAQEALKNPDVDKSVETLLATLERVPLKVRQSRITLNQYIPALRQRAQELQTADGLFEQADTALDKAHRIGETEYGRVQSLLDAIRAVNGLFARRTKVHELQRQLDNARAGRRQMLEGLEDYRQWRVAWASPVAAVGADFSKPVQEMRDTGMQLLDQALELNRNIKAKDEKNIYGLRPWSDQSTPDPLDSDHDNLVQQKTNLATIADLLLDGIKQRDVGDGKVQQAQKLSESSTQDSDYVEAQSLWRLALTDYEMALASLQSAARQFPPLSTRARALAQDAADLTEKVERRRQGILKQVEATTQKLATLVELRASAGEHYGKRQWGASKADYLSILEINPSDVDARRKRDDLERHIRDEEEAKKKFWRRMQYAAVGCIFVLAMFGLASWYFGPGSGRVTATPTPTLAFTSGAGSVVSPSATVKPLASPMPSITPEPPMQVTLYPAKRGCVTTRDTLLNAVPDSSAGVRQSFASGKGFSAIGQTADGKWLIVQLLGVTDPWYVLAVDAVCSK